MREAKSILAAGGLLSVDVHVPAGEPVDTVAARAWQHPALGDRKIVRLVPEALVPGADAEMNALGFAAPAPGPAVARQRRRAPGFPGWALLNDPKNARYALEVVQDLKKAQRQAQSKPGHAREAIVAIGQKLARTTPHFLPSFWEEAGRLFLGVGNHTYAAQSFEKAREAERQFALPVDEAVRAEAFLEFALAGALAAKSLVAYARSLSESADKPRAYALFYDLCLRRTLGGVAPFSGMGKELRTLAKAARLDAPSEERRFLRDALPSPAMQKCPAEAWKTWRASLLALSREVPEVTTRLLDLFPNPSGDEDAYRKEWLGLLREAGAIESLLKSESGRASSWLRKLIDWLDDPNEATLEVLRTLAPKLIADAVPVTLLPSDDWKNEMDPLLLELALTLGVPVVNPGEDDTLDLGFWAKGGEKAADLVRIHADSRFRPLIAKSLTSVVGDEDFEKAARGKPSLKEARHDWLVERVVALSSGGLPDVDEALETLEESTGPAIYAEFPDILERLRQVDLAPVLARTLQGGVFDELGWPALEAAHAELKGSGPKPAEVEVGGIFPHLVLHTDRKAVVLGPHGVVFSHDLKLGKGCNPVGFRYSGGQLLVVYRDDDYSGKAYWSGTPNEVFDVASVYRFGWRSQPGARLADGRVVDSGRALSPGDTTFAERGSVYCDGVDCFVQVHDDDEKVPPEQRPLFQRVDVTTGKAGAAGRPAFFESFVTGRADRRLGPTEALSLLPAPAGLTESPMGVSDGLVGQRSRTLPPKKPEPGVGDPDDADEEVHGDVLEVEGIDGRTWSGWIDDGAPNALIRFPGSDTVLAITGGGYRGDHEIWRAAGVGGSDKPSRLTWLGPDDDERPAGTPILPRLEFWHCFSPREPAASAALRGVTEDQGRALHQGAIDHAAAVAAAVATQKGKRKSDDDPNAELPIEAVRATLPTVQHAGLLAGIAQQAKLAADLTHRIAKLTGAVAADAADEIDDPDALSDEGIQEIIGRRLSGTWYASGELSKHILAVSAALTRESPPDGTQTVPSSNLPWMRWIGHESALIFFACGPRAATEENAETRATLPKLLRLLADSPWVKNPAAYRVVELTFESEKANFVALDPDMDPDDYEADDTLPVAEAWIACEGGHTWAVQRVSDDTDRPILVRALTNAPADVVPKGATQTSSAPARSGPYGDRLRRGADMAETSPLTAVPAGLGEAIAAETGLTPAEAVFAYAGMPVVHQYAADILGKPLREALGLKSADAKLARDGLGNLKDDKLFALYAECVPDDPGALSAPLTEVSGGAPVRRFIDAFLRHFGPRVPLPPELIAAVEKLEGLEMDVRDLLVAAATPASPSIFHNDGQFTLGTYGDVDRVDEGDTVFDAEAAMSFSIWLGWAAHALPVGDRFRTSLPELLALVRARLDNPGLLLSLGTWYGDGKKTQKAQKAWFDSLGGTPFAPKVDAGEDPLPVERGRDTGLLVVYCDDEGDPSAAWRPAQCRDAASFAAIEQVRKLFGSEDDTDALDAVRFLRSEGAAALADRAARSPLPAGGSELDPRASAPETVTAAAAALGVDPDAAALYLQTLTLAQPTQRNVQTWNDWKPAAYKKAADALVEKGLVVGGKRPRAGREHFLPGGWEELSSPDLPMESWKVGLYDLKRLENGKLFTPFGQVLPSRPVHTLFAAAWARYAAGDRPALEAIATGRAAAAKAKKGAKS